jgi:hypothetical protein
MSVVARAAHLAAIRNRGLRVSTPDGEIVVPCGQLPAHPILVRRTQYSSPSTRRETGTSRRRMLSRHRPFRGYIRGKAIYTGQGFRGARVAGTLLGWPQ